MSKIVQRSIQIEEEISALKSLDRRLLPTDSRAKYQYSERTLKLLKAAEQHSSKQKYAGYTFSDHVMAYKVYKVTQLL
jgi:hypothetical protein